MIDADAVYREMRSAIIDGRFPPGTRLVEVDLAQRYNVSRVPIREALNRLDQGGLVRRRPRPKGAVVASLEEEEVRDLYAVRALLEGLAVRLTTERANSSDVDELVNILDSSESARANGGANNEGCALAVNEFHEAMLRGAHSSILSRTLENIRDLSFVTRGFVVTTGRSFEAAEKEHRAILALVKQGQGVRAEHLMRLHVMKSLERYQQTTRPSQAGPA